MNSVLLSKINYEIRLFRRENSVSKPKAQEAVANKHGYQNYQHMLRTLKGRGTVPRFFAIWYDDDACVVRSNFPHKEYHHSPTGIQPIDYPGSGAAEAARQICLNLFPYTIEHGKHQPSVPYQLLKSAALDSLLGNDRITIIPVEFIVDIFNTPIVEDWEAELLNNDKLPETVISKANEMETNKASNFKTIKKGTKDSAANFVEWRVESFVPSKDKLFELCQTCETENTSVETAVRTRDLSFFSNIAFEFVYGHSFNSLRGDYISYDIGGNTYFHPFSRDEILDKAATYLLNKLEA